MADNALELKPPSQLAEYQEQNVSMVQQYATARIQSAYQVALARPRDVDAIRQNVLRECKRPSFCAPDESKNGSSLAIYRVPRGSVKDEKTGNWVNNNIQGPTIRFAEMMLREYKYLSIEVNPMGEDENQRLLQVILTDYQACNFTSEIVTVPKRVERKKMKPGDELVSQRTNTYGDPVYIVKATDDELAMKTNALVSKARRNLILQAVPGWLIEEAIEQVRETARTKDAQDPDAAKRKLFDAFATVGVSAAQLSEYLGHSNALSPAELEDLRGYFSGIKEGFTTWAAVMAAKDENKDEDGTAAAIEKAFEILELPPAQMRKIKGKHVGQPAKLLEWLQGEVAKKQNTGGKKEPSEPDPTKTTQSTAPQTSDGQQPRSQSQPSTSAQTGGGDNQDAEPAPKQDTKPTPAATKPAPPPVDDDEY